MTNLRARIIDIELVWITFNKTLDQKKLVDFNVHSHSLVCKNDLAAFAFLPQDNGPP